MNVSIFPESGKWLLVLNPTETDRDESEIGETLPTASAFDQCWTGEHWAEGPSEGQQFESRVEAAVYLHDHWQRMENLAMARHDPIPVPSDLPFRGL
jgi:hypothetical protein